jgi:hypothetical protein
MSKPITRSIAGPLSRSPGAGFDAQRSPTSASAGIDDSPPRRRFMRAALCAPAVAVAATSAKAAPEARADTVPEAEAPVTGSSYRETAHIRTYYDLAAY